MVTYLNYYRKFNFSYFLNIGRKLACEASEYFETNLNDPTYSKERRSELRIKKSLKIILLLSSLVFCAGAVGAAPLPWLDFGFNFLWDQSDESYSNAYLGVGSVTYTDGTYSPPAPIDQVIGSPVTLTMSFDGNANDTLTIEDWFTADIVILSNNFDPLAMNPNPYMAYLDNVSPIPGGNIGVLESRWWDEFSATIDPNREYDAQLVLSFIASNPLPASGGKYIINGMGKVAPAPEPATMLLLGAGLISFGVFGRKKLKK